MAEQKRVLVYGATGVQGGPVVRRLLEAGHRVRVLARHPERATGLRETGAEVVVGDMGDGESLRAASEGVDAVSLLLPQVFDSALLGTLGRNAIDAAVAAAARRVVYNVSTTLPRQRTDLPALEVRRELEDYLRDQRIEGVVLRPVVYMENFAGPWTAPGIVGQGVLAYPVPERVKASWITADDVAAITVAAIEHPELSGMSFDLGGPEALDGTDLAARFSAALGRTVRYQAIPLDSFEQGLNAALGAPAGTEIARQYRWREAHPEDSMVVDMRPVLEALPVRLTTLDAWIRGRAEFARTVA